MVISNSYSVRSAQPEDVPGIAMLFAAYRQFYGLPSDNAQLVEFLHARMHAGDAHILLAVEKSVPVAFTQLYPGWCSLALARYFILYDLYVDQAHRRKGLGAQLLTAAAHWARGQGADRLELATGVNNKAAQALYRQLGWQRDHEYYYFNLPLVR
ncbi:GNAT family N-acetyltransferase [Simiduia sp. 21SJ11W-1]|uniref:GNAT family N-acetyltransferase n=1 Tax=Simiduia sp. 21SJ11W-1 TaxID=2909669 RepID=UPI0020A22253|nr:GNAT family N-acetyltransferase [Simiduia sp. 21SJ11W-1]UTA47191.1 GNAT family N-acetyltransferase [Simiduia sp. 21SJ11W-1]